MRAVRHHTQDNWVVLYIERWLRAEVQLPDGRLVARERGTPQGGVVSPLLANLFLQQLSFVRSYVLEDGRLHLATMAATASGRACVDRS